MTRNTKDQTLRGRLRQIFLFSWRDCAVCVGILAAAGLLCALLRMIDSSDVYVALIFECAVVLVSRFTDGYLFGLLASVIGVVGVNWIFTYPYMQLNFTISGYPLTFLVMLAVSVVVGTLTTQIKQQEKLRAEAEREKNARQSPAGRLSRYPYAPDRHRRRHRRDSGKRQSDFTGNQQRSAGKYARRIQLAHRRGGKSAVRHAYVRRFEYQKRSWRREKRFSAQPP